jgi:hypothetical protein
MSDRLVDFGGSYYEKSVLRIVQEGGGIPVRQDGGKVPMDGDSDSDYGELVEWVTPLTTYNRQTDAFATYGTGYGNESTLDWAYGDLCMIVRIGKAGDRLAFPSVDQVKRELRRGSGGGYIY